jgi:hypothetical protein
MTKTRRTTARTIRVLLELREGPTLPISSGDDSRVVAGRAALDGPSSVLTASPTFVVWIRRAVKTTQHHFRTTENVSERRAWSANNIAVFVEADYFLVDRGIGGLAISKTNKLFERDRMRGDDRLINVVR